MSVGQLVLYPWASVSPSPRSHIREFHWDVHPRVVVLLGLEQKHIQPY